jgi:hypothetical protein
MRIPPAFRVSVLAILVVLAGLPPIAAAATQDAQNHDRDHDRDHDEHHRKETARDGEDARPAWFLTLHGESGGNTVLAFAADGRPLGPAVAAVPEADGGPLKDLRGMARLPDGGLLLVNAFKDRTFVARFGAGDGAIPRPFVGVPIRGGPDNPALVHPYQIALASDGTIYLSNQDSNTVTRYAALDGPEPGRPLPPPASLAGVSGLAPGTFLAAEAQVKDGLREVRGVLVAPDGSVLVADKKRSSVTRHEATTGRRLATLLGPEHGAKGPIQLAMAPDGALLVGDNEKEVVWRVPLDGGPVRQLLDCSSEGVKAPSVIAVDGNTLLVGSRSAKRIDRFDLASGAKLGVFAKDLPDAPEFLLRVAP